MPPCVFFLMTNPYVTGVVLEVSGGETLVSNDEREATMVQVPKA